MEMILSHYGWKNSENFNHLPDELVTAGKELEDGRPVFLMINFCA